ncbi:Nucleoside ABC transporter, permease protein 2 [hydrothermal vent metagenome]|uniref:Nucleoside ABC transporter, permease protein 2 n=1 Tax=hydrothermal vent metagenome TaxID=652676 RepID=A0A3B0R9Z1_9ZZZZ
MDWIELFVSAGFWAAMLRIAAPLIFGTIGELICERAGVLNLGIEGIMTMGAMTGWMWVFQGGSLWGGVMFAASVGAIFGLLHAIFVVHLGLSQHVSGIGITLLASSLSYFIFRMMLPDSTTPPKIVPFQPVKIPWLSDLPFFGQAFFSHTPLTYLALAIIPVAIYMIYRTPVGRAVRMAGENPVALEAQGIDVLLIRTGAVMVGSALMAIGGAYLTISAFDAFFFGMINGRGWICIALVIFASWKPGRALFGALLFAGLDAFQVRAQQLAGGAIPYQFFLMLPYLLSIGAMIVISKSMRYPKALLVPFRRGDRI